MPSRHVAFAIRTSLLPATIKPNGLQLWRGLASYLSLSAHKPNLSVYAIASLTPISLVT